MAVMDDFSLEKSAKKRYASELIPLPHYSELTLLGARRPATLEAACAGWWLALSLGSLMLILLATPSEE